MALEVKAVEALRAEIGIEVLTVGEARVGGEASGPVVGCFDGRGFAQDFFPGDLARISVDGQ